MKVSRLLKLFLGNALLLGVLPGSQASSQAPSPSVPPKQSLRPSRIVPAKPARWEFIDQRGEVVDYELGSEGGWYYWPPFLQWRVLEFSQWVTPDPIVEVD